MSINTKTALVVARMLGAGSAGFAQGVVPDYDGDGNPIAGQYEALSPASSADARNSARPLSSIERSFAGPRTVVTEPVYPYGANGPEWQRHFDNWLSSVD
jgi:hypothetical protein